MMQNMKTELKNRKIYKPNFIFDYTFVRQKMPFVACSTYAQRTIDVEMSSV